MIFFADRIAKYLQINQQLFSERSLNFIASQIIKIVADKVVVNNVMKLYEAS